MDIEGTSDKAYAPSLEQREVEAAKAAIEELSMALRPHFDMVPVKTSDIATQTLRVNLQPVLQLGLIYPEKKNWEGTSYEALLKIAAETFGYTLEEARSKSRRGMISVARGMAIDILMELNNPISASEIGRIINRDHSTVMYNLKRIQKHYKENPALLDTREKIIGSFENEEYLREGTHAELPVRYAHNLVALVDNQILICPTYYLAKIDRESLGYSGEYGIDMTVGVTGEAVWTEYAPLALDRLNALNQQIQSSSRWKL